MKRLSFFKVYGRVDPRLDEIRGGSTMMSNGGILSILEDAFPVPQLMPYQCDIISLMESNYRIGRERQAQGYEFDYNYLMSADMVESFRENLISQMANVVARGALARASLGAVPYPLPLQEEMTVEQIREREEQAFKTLDNRPREAVTQDRIDKAFGVNADEKQARKESLRAHAWTVRNNLERSGKSTNEVEAFIKSLGLDGSDE